MKAALVVPADKPGQNNYHQVPIGSLYTAEQLRRQGFDVAFYDLRVHPRDDDSVYDDIANAQLAVVFSTDYDLAQCYPSLSPTVECVRRIKSAGQVPVACAGSHATADPLLTRKHTGADIAVTGEFEFAIPDLLRHLKQGGEVPELWPSTGVRLADENELEELGAPAYDLAPMSRYFSENFVDNELDRVRSGLVLANRGCPFGCSFCYLFFGRPLRRRPVAATIAELKAMKEEHGIEHFFFLDYTFTIDNAWVRELCDGIREQKLDVSWLCQTRVDCLDEETLKLMKEAGCSGIWLGVESPEMEQRRYLSKGKIGFEVIEDGIALIRNCGLNVLAFVMVGMPNETESSLLNLNKWLEKSQVYYSLSIFQRRLGTPLAKKFAGAEVVQENGWGYLDLDSEFLGESKLRRADLDWFFEFHEKSPTRVANVMRRRKATTTS